MMLGLLRQYPTNLRTIIVFYAVLVMPTCPSYPQARLSGTTALAVTDALESPLCAIGHELAIEAAPAPFGLASISRVRIACGLPQHQAVLALQSQGAPGLLQTQATARAVWVPRSDYRVAGQINTRWMALDAFPDQWSCNLEMAAEMSIAEWRIGVGLLDAVVCGRTPRPMMLVGISTVFAMGSAGIELASTWGTTPLVTISTQVKLGEAVSAGISIGASPMTIDVAVRVPADEGLDLVLAIRQRERLGLTPRVTLCWQSPSWLP